MRCPYCEVDDDRVVDSRPTDGGAAVRRRRHCNDCGERFSTIERTEAVSLLVVKRDGTSEPFELAKIATSIGRALSDATPEDVTELAGAVEAAVRRGGRGRVRSEAIGEAVLGALRTVDTGAYLRFASVYKEFRTVEDYQRELASLPEEP